jgi:hypothetical protein
MVQGAVRFRSLFLTLKTFNNMNVTFKKLDSTCYLVTNGDNAINVYVRYSSSNKHYEVDAGQFYWELKSINDMKTKVSQYFQENKFQCF